MFKGFILCDKRTGSTFLQNAMDSHPNITCFDELFMIRTGLKKRHGQFMYRWIKDNKKWNKDTFLDWLGENNDRVFLKLIYEQCDYWNLTKEIKRRNLSIIHLIRKNHFKRAMSGLLKKNFNKNKKVNIDPNKILSETIKSKKKANLYVNKWKNYKNQIYVYYEDMIGRKEGEENNVKKVGAFNMKSDQITYLKGEISEKICNFMDIPHSHMFCNITKKSKENPMEYLTENKQKELKQLFKKNKILGFLD